MPAVKIGDQVLFEGFSYQVVGIMGHQAVIFHPEVSNTSAFVVPMCRLEYDAQAMFAIGDQVRSHNTFRGVVTGFEEETNRVICCSSLGTTADRRRYAYKPNELTHC